MAERLNVASKSESIQRYRQTRSATFQFVTATVDRIVRELNSKASVKKMERVDLFFDLMAQQLAEVKKWNEKIAESAPVCELYKDLKTSMDFFLQTSDRIINAASGKEEEDTIIAKLKVLLPLFQMSTSECNQTDWLQLPPVKKLAIKDSSLQRTQEPERSTAQHQRVLKHLVLEMPKFKGNRLKWIEFWDTFETEIHNDPSMTDAHKFSYLKGLLSGKQFDFIKNMRTDDENYARAVSILKSRYGNVDQLVSLHKNTLLTMMPEGFRNTFRDFFFTIESSICALEYLGVKTDTPFFVTSLLNRLPSDIQKYIYQKLKKKDGDLIGMNDLRETLSLRVEKRED